MVLSGNSAIGFDTITVKDGAKQGISISKGVCAMMDGRWGEVQANPDSDNEVKLTWSDDGSTSGWIKADKLTSSVTKAEVSMTNSLVETLRQNNLHISFRFP